MRGLWLLSARNATHPLMPRFLYAPFNRDSLKTFVNTSAPLAAFTAGGLYIKFDRTLPDSSPLSKAIAVIHICALHLQICSFLTSAMLTFVIVRLKDEQEVKRWATEHWILIRLPAYKFVFGILLYLIDIIFIAYRTFESTDFEKVFTLVFGCASLSMLSVTAAVLRVDEKRSHPGKADPVQVNHEAL